MKLTDSSKKELMENCIAQLIHFMVNIKISRSFLYGKQTLDMVEILENI